MVQAMPGKNDNAQVSIYSKDGSLIERTFGRLRTLADVCAFAKVKLGTMPKDGVVKVVPLRGEVIPFM